MITVRPFLFTNTYPNTSIAATPNPAAEWRAVGCPNSNAIIPKSPADMHSACVRAHDELNACHTDTSTASSLITCANQKDNFKQCVGNNVTWVSRWMQTRHGSSNEFVVQAVDANSPLWHSNMKYAFCTKINSTSQVPHQLHADSPDCQVATASACPSYCHACTKQQEFTYELDVYTRAMRDRLNYTDDSFGCIPTTVAINGSYGEVTHTDFTNYFYMKLPVPGRHFSNDFQGCTSLGRRYVQTGVNAATGVTCYVSDVRPPGTSCAGRQSYTLQ